VKYHEKCWVAIALVPTGVYGHKRSLITTLYGIRDGLGTNSVWLQHATRKEDCINYRPPQIDNHRSERRDLLNYFQACRGYGYPWIYPWILRWHNTIALNLCAILASYRLLTNCTFLMIICFNYLLLYIFITISERNACVMVVLIWRPTPCCALWNRSGFLHVSHRQAIGSPWVYPWIYPRIFPWISTKKICGYGCSIRMGNFISTASLTIMLLSVWNKILDSLWHSQQKPANACPVQQKIQDLTPVEYL